MKTCSRDKFTIRNLANSALLAVDATIASTFFRRVVGLLNRSYLNKGEALVIIRCPSIHTFFMRFAIDALFVSKKNIVVKVVNDMKPFRMTNIYPGADYVIELPAGAIARTHTQEGDIIEIMQNPSL